MHGEWGTSLLLWQLSSESFCQDTGQPWQGLPRHLNTQRGTIVNNKNKEQNNASPCPGTGVPWLLKVFEHLHELYAVQLLIFWNGKDNPNPRVSTRLGGSHTDSNNPTESSWSYASVCFHQEHRGCQLLPLSKTPSLNTCKGWLMGWVSFPGVCRDVLIQAPLYDSRNIWN